MDYTLEKTINNLGEIVKREAIALIGIDGGSTSNEKEMNGRGVIPGMWARFTEEKIIEKIPNLIEDYEIIAAYYDIESDDKGPYSFFIGLPVSSIDIIPDGLSVLKIPEQKFLKVSTSQGSFQTIGIEAWMKIWASNELRKNRRFDVDLEVYGLEAANPEDGRFDIFVGLK